MKTLKLPESGVTKLKLNVTNIKSILIDRSKSLKKINAKKESFDQQAQIASDRSEEEKKLEKKKSPLKRIGKKVGKKIASTTKGIFDKILSFAMPLITAIVINNIDKIAESIRTFYENNRAIFDGIGKAINVLGKGFMMIVNFISGMEESKDAKKMKELDSTITNLQGHLKKIEPLEKLGKKLKGEADKAKSKSGAEFPEVEGGDSTTSATTSNENKTELKVSPEAEKLMDHVINDDPESLKKDSTSPTNPTKEQVEGDKILERLNANDTTTTTTTTTTLVKGGDPRIQSVKREAQSAGIQFNPNSEVTIDLDSLKSNKRKPRTVILATQTIVEN